MIPIETTIISKYNSYNNEEYELVKMKSFVNQYEILQARNKTKIFFMKNEIYMIFNTQVNKAHIGLMKTKHEQTSRVSA